MRIRERIAVVRTLSSPLRSTLALFGAALAFVAGCAANHPVSPAPVSGERPRLVVLLVVDGLPQRQVIEYWDQLAPDGLKRFLDRGAWFSDAHYGHAVTETGPGHATILTGAYPHRSGIIANQWRNPGTGELENCVADPSAPYVGRRAARLEGASPKNLMVESLGDVLKRLDARSKVIAISGKDRGAVLPAGKAGTAYVFQAQTGEFASTTYYMKEHPQWVGDFNAKKTADAFFHQEWKPLLAEPAYARSVPDERPWFARGGKLPKTLGQGQDEPGPRFYGEVLASPFGDELLLAFARAAIEGESLGRDAAPDILVVSLSSHDYINHAYGAESRISQDHVLYLDRAVQDFLNDLDISVGRDNYLAVLTADHGFMPAPEYSQSLGRDAGRLNPAQMLARLNAGLAKKFGDGRWVLSMSAHGVLFNRLLMTQRSVTLPDVSEEARRLLLEERAIEAVYTRVELESGSRAGAPAFEAMRNTWHRERSGDLQIELKPYWMYDSGTTGTTHGSHYPYDTNVPILIYGPSWVSPGRIDRHVEVVDIAPTLARILRVPAPAASEGKPLPLEAAVR
jgi:predicted AlkP superfamily pyrophosphatase or phosphodiesterase